MLVAALGIVAGCAMPFRTYYPAQVSSAESANWRLSAVNVKAPHSLSVSEEEVLVPKADIVWREDPRGDRYAQVEKIMSDAVTRGARGLKGKRRVALDVTMTRFHAMTFVAEAQAPGGIHDVEFDFAVRDVATGKLLFGPEHVEASFPAMAGAQMVAARAAGQSQKSQIEANVARAISGILGLGPDARANYFGIGG